MLKKGGHLHPFLQEEIRYILAKPVVEIPEKLRRLWSVLAYNLHIDHEKLLWISQQIKKILS